MNAKLTLISHHLCPYVQRATIALREKDVPFERVNVDLADKPGWFVRLSPLGKVPLLQVGQRSSSNRVSFWNTSKRRSRTRSIRPTRSNAPSTAPGSNSGRQS